MYSPDLAPSDYHLFPALHRWLGGRRFNDNDAIKAAVHEYFAKLDRNFFTDGISKLITRYEKQRCCERLFLVINIRNCFRGGGAQKKKKLKNEKKTNKKPVSILKNSLNDII